MKIFDALKLGEEKLKSANIEDYMIDGKLILFHLFNMDETSLFLNRDKELSESDLKKYMDVLEKRLNHIPLSEIFNEAYFYGEKFKVNSNVLTPRKETEILVENCIEIIKDKGYIDILDLCTGSGIIGIILKENFPTINIYASDISEEAIKIAKENAVSHNCDISYIGSNMFDNIKGSFDLIVSNPPYIRRNDILELSEEVKNYDPIISLDGGIDGLDFYRTISKEGKTHLKDKGMLALEIGYDEGEDIKKILLEDGYIDITIKKDYAGLDRMIFASKNTGV